MQADPRSAYLRLLEERRAAVTIGELRHRRLGYAQLAAAGVAILVVWAALAQGFTIAWTGIPIAAFIALLILHERTLRDLERRRRAVRFFENALARLDGEWAGRGEAGDRYLDLSHPYAQDLDLFGKGGLFELLSTARTHIGEDTLARWLLSPSDPATLRERNAAIDELRPRVDLREDLAVVGEDARTGVDPAALAVWGEAPTLLPRGAHLRLRLFTALGVITLAAILASGLDWSGILEIPPAAAITARYVLILGILANGFYMHRIGKAVDAIVAAVDKAAHQLGLLSEVLARLEREQFQSPLLARLRARLETQGQPSSKRLARLAHLAEALDSRDNLFVRMLEMFILWTPRHAAEVEDWRRDSGPAVRGWLEMVGEVEALSSLASHAYEHPADTFAEFVEDGACLDAQAIAHPLIPEGRAVRNDLRLGGALRVLVVSGSNMSGKSTMLRTLGTNVVLAQAGAPVRAARLRLSPLQVGASIRLNDSLQGGVSRFYAEILRLRQILDLTGGARPVLFLIDEFLNGTNSHDRRIGAQALVRGLVERGAVGLITTHDLALAEIADSLGERAANVHFEDTVEDGKIHFDYVVRPGVVRKSNAIELMRSVGLEI
jgi:CBS domain-containing protein